MYGSKKGKTVSVRSIHKSKGFYWVDAQKASDIELSLLNKVLGVSMYDLKNANDTSELPRAGNRKDYNLLVFRVPTKLSTTSLGIFISDHFVLTVHKEAIPVVRKVFGSLEANDKSFRREDLSLIVHHVLVGVTKEFSVKLDKIGDNIEKIENKVFRNSSEDDIKNLFNLKKQLLYFRKSMAGNEQVVDRIDQLKYFSKYSHDHFRALHVEITQVNGILEIYRERLVEAMNIYMGSLSNKLNDIMKGFTVIATLLLLPTLISGVWGMNFAEIPWFENQYGFYYPIVLMFVSMVLLLWFFKRKSWI